MANRRMFSKDIINSGEFQDLSLLAQLLYFHIGMNADDDGFCECRILGVGLGCTDAEFCELMDAGFIIKVPGRKTLYYDLHWLENNKIRSDRYTPSRYHDLIYIPDSKNENNKRGIYVGDDFVNRAKQEYEATKSAMIPHGIPGGSTGGIPDGIPGGNDIPTGTPTCIPDGIPTGSATGTPHGTPTGIPDGSETGAVLDTQYRAEQVNSGKERNIYNNAQSETEPSETKQDDVDYEAAYRKRFHKSMSEFEFYDRNAIPVANEYFLWSNFSIDEQKQFLTNLSKTDKDEVDKWIKDTIKLIPNIKKGIVESVNHEPNEQSQGYDDDVAPFDELPF